MLFVDLMLLIDKLKAMSFSMKLSHQQHCVSNIEQDLWKLFQDMCQDIYVMKKKKAKKGEEFIMRMPIGKADYQIYIFI